MDRCRRNGSRSRMPRTFGAEPRLPSCWPPSWSLGSSRGCSPIKSSPARRVSWKPLVRRDNPARQPRPGDYRVSPWPCRRRTALARRLPFPNEMNLSLLAHEWIVVGLGLAILLIDLWLTPAQKPKLGYLAALGMVAVLLYSFLGFSMSPDQPQFAFGGLFVLDGL